jgi:hypothetical protein
MKKEKILLIAGCSHSAGSEIDGNEDSSYNRLHSFGGLIATKLKKKPINIAQVGATNAGIARQVINWFEKEYNPETMYVNVLVGWTEPTRLEVPSEKVRAFQHDQNHGADWFDESANDYYKVIIGWDGGDDEERKATPLLHRYMVEQQPMLEVQSYTNIMQIQHYLESKKISSLMCNTMPFFLDNIPAVKNLLPLINANKYYCLGNKDEAFFTKYQALGYTNRKAKYWHHDEIPHAMFAEELLKFNEEHKCLKK